jgi:hypothetical protein
MIGFFISALLPYSGVKFSATLPCEALGSSSFAASLIAIRVLDLLADIFLSDIARPLVSKSDIRSAYSVRVSPNLQREPNPLEPMLNIFLWIDGLEN